MTLCIASGFLTAFKIREKNNINTSNLRNERDKILSEIEVLKESIKKVVGLEISTQKGEDM